MMQLLFTYLFEVSILLAIFYSFYFFILKPSPAFQWNRAYLILSYLCSFFIPFISLDIYPIYQEMLPVQLFEGTPVEIKPVSVDVSKEASPYHILFLVYLTGVVIVMSRFIVSLWSISRQVIYSPKSTHNGYVLIHDREKLGVHSFFHFLFANETECQNKEIIEHELVHIKEGHTYDLLISEVVKALLWFNPFSHLMQSAIKLNHEFICDKKASKINGAFAYAQLLTQVNHQYKLSIANSFSYKLKNRIIMLQNPLNDRRRWRYLLILPLLFATLHVFSFEKYPVVISTESENLLIDTFPIVKKYVYDTTSVFNSHNYEETITVVRSEKEFYEITDTVRSINPKTNEEKVDIVTRYEEVIRPPNKVNRSEIDLDSRHDTITIIDFDTYEEVVSVVPRSEECYTLKWGNHYFRGSSNVKIELVQSFLYEDLSLDLNTGSTNFSNCDKVNSFNAVVSVVPLKGDPKSQILNESNLSIDKEFISNGYLREGTKIFVDRIKVNDKTELDPIVIVLHR